MDLLTDIAVALTAVVSLLVAAGLARYAWRRSRLERERNARLLNSVYEQQLRRRREE